ncbi:hypothetical protein CHU32_02265 [Superficieibacter electus]|uniref:Uncharacterized protein n=1 Tax=Superficieibacter electus TaxID=2022662 RepID=A0A2P5GUN2_9ENTR|nr:hypothetical protein CHU33_25185 [Superficieibacter electus]POP50270.1 hypothetical protein CHU32_02265 [Superficieibacter electus]
MATFRHAVPEPNSPEQRFFALIRPDHDVNLTSSPVKMVAPLTCPAVWNVKKLLINAASAGRIMLFQPLFYLSRDVALYI